ncbi:DNA-binding domain-containing protein, AraC-type [Chryseobacterium populi]|uniref:DNA-binding domain-containing protein, AraC-type n=2 Tax=Chryseobacterium populi TaxID=1144316 RepID=J3CCA0_9FLAO|nr:helix-turn-helix domain-containing protein [Chryseobacterium populi]EJL68719.1 DNA-binding domain-containing protein, AraC-type [Chryseobacterium populi]
MSINVNLETYQISRNSIIFFPSQSYTHILKISQNIKSIVISFSDDFALSNLKNYNDINIVRLLSDNSTLITSLSPESSKSITGLADNLYQLNSDREQLFAMERIYHCFNSLTLELMVLHSKMQEDYHPKTSRQKTLIQNFMNMLFTHCKKERSVQFYADKLAVTPGYLSKILKEVSGLTASDIIEDAVVIEARNMLQNSNLSITQIADELHFSDQSFFGKFFKKKMKMSPREFRTRKVFT